MSNIKVPEPRSNCDRVYLQYKKGILKHDTIYLRNPASSPCSTGKSSSPDGTRNPSVVHDFRLGDSFDLTIFSVSSVDSSVMLTLQSTL